MDFLFAAGLLVSLLLALLLAVYETLRVADAPIDRRPIGIAIVPLLIAFAVISALRLLALAGFAIG